jgi:hypothetical protein
MNTPIKSFAIEPQIFLATNNINFSALKSINNESDGIMVSTSENVKNLLNDGA